MRNNRKRIAGSKAEISRTSKKKNKPHIVGCLFNKSTTNKVALLKLIAKLIGRREGTNPKKKARKTS